MIENFVLKFEFACNVYKIGFETKLLIKTTVGKHIKICIFYPSNCYTVALGYNLEMKVTSISAIVMLWKKIC